MFDDGTIKEGLKSGDAAIKFSTFDFVGATYPAAMSKAETEFNKIRTEIINISKNEPTYSAINTNPRAVKTKIQEKRSLKFNNINDDIVKLQKLSQTHLIDPYLTPSASSVRKGHTLSNFVAGVITLDPNVVKGYDPNSGEILIRPEWKATAATVAVPDAGANGNSLWDKSIKWITSLFSGTDTEVEKVADTLSNGDLQFEIYSYAKLFENKMWGFYYLIQERFDIGYTSLASSLLLLMSAWFFATVGIGEVVKYHSDNENYKMQMNEAGYIKTIVIVGIISMFFLSMPSGSSDTADSSGATKSNEMRKNYTLAKTLIRKSAQLGMDTASMFNDLGLSAFIQYVVKRELMMSVDEIRAQLEQSTNDLYMLAPASDLKKECAAYYSNVSDAAFYASIDDLSFPINQSWKDQTYAKGKNISAIDYNVCMKAYKVYALAPYQVALAVGTADEQLKKADDKLSEATYMMSYNNIALNEKMGWVSGFGVTLEYFILKNNDMFLSEELDEDAIKETAKNITGAMVNDGDDLQRRGIGGAVQDNVAYAAAWVIDFANGLFIYNILPAFGDIQSSVYGYMENVYDSKLRIYLAKKKDKNESGLFDLFDKIKSLITKIPDSDMFHQQFLGQFLTR